MANTERKYTYKVEIDAAQAKAQAEALRRTLTEMLGEIAPQQRGGLADVIQQAQKPAQDLNRTLEETQKRLRDLRNEYERMNQTAAAAASRGTARSRANFSTYVDEVRKAAGDEAAAAARRTGRATTIGNLGAQFKDDETGRYLEAERDAARAYQEANEKMRFTAEEKRQLAEIESQLAQTELQEIQVRRQIAQEQKADADRLIAAWESSGAEFDAATAEIMEGSDRLAAEIKQMADDETQMMDAAARANQRLQDVIQQQDKEMRRAEARATGTIAQAGGTIHAQQTAITVTQASAANAERFSKAMQDAAIASERLEQSRMSTNVRGFELELERERQKIIASREKAGLIEAESARQATAVVQQEQRRQTLTVQGETQERIAMSRAEADVLRNEARAAATERMEQERRLTAQTRAEIRERERAARLTATSGISTGAGRRPFSLSGMAGTMGQLDMYAGMLAGGLGAFGAVQVAQSVYNTGKEGAILQRQQATFQEFSRRMGQNADTIVAAVQRASNSTITEFDAMGLASQVLASKFSQDSQDIAGDLETVTAFARRASQIFVDESGQALSVQEVFARLVKFAREGNKELVDQFGLSNQLIAQAMGTTVDGLASAQGATIRWQGLVKVLNQELERLGPAAVTTAERFEQSAARIEEARQRIQMALAGPVAGIAEGVAGGVEGATTLAGMADLDRLRGMIGTRIGGATGGLSVLNAGAYEEARKALLAYDAAMKTNAETARTYAEQLRAVLNNLVNQGTLVKTDVAQLKDLQVTLDLVAQGLDTYSVAMQVTTMEGMRHNEQIFQLAQTMAAYEKLYKEGSVTLEQYGAVMVSLAGRMREAADASGYLSTQLADTYSMIGPIAETGTQRTGSGSAGRQPFLDPEAAPWGLPEGMSEREAAARAALLEWRNQQNAELNRIVNETQNPAMQDVRTGMLDQLTGAEEQLQRLSAAYDLLGESATDAMTANLDAISEQIDRLRLLDQTAVLVDEAMKSGQEGAAGLAAQLVTLAGEVASTNTVTAEQVGILQQLIGALLGATSAALGFEGAQTQYGAAMAAKSAKYAVYGNYSYGMLAPRFDADRTAQQDAMYQRGLDARRAQDEWAAAAKKTASEFERAAEAAAAAFEGALRKVPGLFGTSSVTGEQMAGAAAGVPQEFADNYLRRLADEVAGNKDWAGIDIQDAARRAGIDPNLPKEIILQQFQAAWADSSLFSGGRNIDLITEFGGLDAIKANLARQDASASGQQALIDFLAAAGLGVGAPGAPTAEGAPGTAETTVAAIQGAFNTENVAEQLAAVGENTIAMIHAGYKTGAFNVDWTGPITDAVVAQLSGQIAAMFGEEPPPP